MAAINFPDNPIDGEEYTAENGVTYTYNASIDAWTGTSSAGAGDSYWKLADNGTSLTTIDADQNLLLGGTLDVAGKVTTTGYNINALTPLPDPLPD